VVGRDPHGAGGVSCAGAGELAHDLAHLPQTCLRSDPASALDQWDLSFEAAMANELRLDATALAAPDLAVNRFVAGEGRHGAAS